MHGVILPHDETASVNRLSVVTGQLAGVSIVLCCGNYTCVCLNVRTSSVS